MAALAFPGTAFGATASVQGRVLTYASSAPYDNTLSVDGPGCFSPIQQGPCPPEYVLVRISDSGTIFGRPAGEPITPGAGCRRDINPPPLPDPNPPPFPPPPPPIAPENEVYCSPDIDSIAIDLGAGDDWLFFSTNKPGVLSGGTGDERFDAKPGADVVMGGEGSDTYNALPCPERARARDAPCDPVANSSLNTGPDTFLGGPGQDTADYSGVLAAGSFSADGVADDGRPGEGDDIRPDVENIRGGPLSDRLAGNASDNELAGGGGEDTILGGSGQDFLDGGAGGDSLDGGVGSDRLFGRDGTDSASYTARTADVDVTLDGAANDGQAGERDQVGSDMENVSTGSGDDDVTGSSLANRIDGGGGEDFLDGRGGEDALLGGGATDVLRMRDGARDPSATCGPGTDFVIADPADTAAADCDDVDRVLADNPVLGRRIAVEPRGGSSVTAQAAPKLRLRLPTARRFVPLQDHLNLPVRSMIDATAGKARLASRAVGSRRRRHGGVFSDGLFQVLQSGARRRRGLTELRLKGSSFRGCSARRGRARSTARRYSRRTVRRLRGSGRGRFRTRGRYSAATVRGTIWTVADRCDGTLTRVRRGRVAVRDFRRRATVLLRPGKSYLARARR